MVLLMNCCDVIIVLVYSHSLTSGDKSQEHVFSKDAAHGLQCVLSVCVQSLLNEMQDRHNTRTYCA